MNRLVSFLTTLVFIFSGILFTGCKEDEKGLVTAITLVGGTYNATCRCNQFSLKDNASLQVTAFVMPRDAANQNVTFASKNNNIFDVSGTGLITPKAIGIDTLIVSATDRSGISTRYQIIVTDHMVKATAINVTAAGSNMTLKIGGAPFDLAAQVTLAPADTWNKTVTYQSNNEAIAVVTADGTVSPTGVGSTTITIRTVDGSNLSRNVNVTVQ